MFGVIAAGRLVNTDAQQVAENKFAFAIPSPESINHVVVFMTGAAAFPPGTGASIHCFWPDSGLQLLGFLTNDKPSAIFKIAKTKPANPILENPYATSIGGPAVAQIGISIEPLELLVRETPDSAARAPTAADLELFTQKMLESFYTFATSFASPREEALRRQDDTWIPLGVLMRWKESFYKKMQLDPLFWRK
eukprot:m.214083 g.214083  ORF g.214083 m.214083 type:complete len:193 (+) comp19068_c0_seq2:142-720(+)